GRMFDPLSGIMEDPATGSASAILASQLLNSGVLNEGQNEFSLFQGYDMGRPSNIDLEIDVSNGKIQAVRVAGSAVFISSGKISIPAK
ncbi:MAG: PhzF family phenazine biosynthesis protein, partial [Rhizobiales bacterium]|nr:PhzF family phenazine biosynthesis protein [Hyphomicrobiales bacterium]